MYPMSKANVWCKRWYLKKNNLSTYKSLVIGAKTLEISFISDYQAHGLLLQMLSMSFLHIS